MKTYTTKQVFGKASKTKAFKDAYRKEMKHLCTPRKRCKCCGRFLPESETKDRGKVVKHISK